MMFVKPSLTSPSFLKVPTQWFLLAEMVFLIWNSLNDPLVGHYVKGWSVTQRLTALDAPAALWVASFACFFVLPIPLSGWMVGVHLIACLVMYDGFLSYVLLVHASLLADLSNDPVERAACNTWSSVFSIAGSSAVFFSTLLWDAHRTARFRVYCMVVGLCALLVFQLSFRLLRSGVVPKASDAEVVAADSPSFSLRKFASQLKGHGNFWIFCCTNLIQVFNCHFNSNFLLTALSSTAFRSLGTSTLFVLAAVLPHVVVVLLAPFLITRGLYSVMRTLFAFKLLSCLFVLMWGWSAALMAAFLFVNKVMGEAICRHGNLVVADLVDEDMALHGEVASRSSLILGANALFTKPGQAVAAVVGWFVFRGQSEVLDHGESLFIYVVAVPAICGAMQMLLWSQFSLRGAKLAQIKEAKVSQSKIV